MRIAVTGATGFIGKQLLPRLQACGHEIISCHREAGFDLEKPDDFDGFFAGCDIVLHLAALNNSQEANAERFDLINVIGSSHVQEACLRQNVPCLIMASSFHAAYVGGQPDLADAYARSKHAAEKALLSRDKASGTPRTVCLRLPPVHGEDLAGGLASLAGFLGRGLPLPFGACHHPVATLSVGNLARAIVQIGERDQVKEGLYHVQDAAPLSLKELCRALAKRKGKQARLFPVPAGLLAFLLRRVGKEKLAELVRPRVVDGNSRPLVDVCSLDAQTAWEALTQENKRREAP